MIKHICTKCGLDAAEADVELSVTTVPGVQLGRCPNCGIRRTFRATTVADEAAAGAKAAQRGMDLTETAEALMSDWVERADRELEALAGSGERFTAETLTGRIGMPSHPKAVGARFNALARKGRIRKVGFTRANRRAAHSRDLAVWQGVSS